MIVRVNYNNVKYEVYVYIILSIKFSVSLPRPKTIFVVSNVCRHYRGLKLNVFIHQRQCYLENYKSGSWPSLLTQVAVVSDVSRFVTWQVIDGCCCSWIYFCCFGWFPGVTVGCCWFDPGDGSRCCYRWSVLLFCCWTRFRW